MNGVSRKVYMFTIDGELVRSFESLTDCALHFKVEVPTIANSISRGYIFRKHIVLTHSETFPMKKEPPAPKAEPQKPPKEEGTMLEKKVMAMLRDEGKRLGIPYMYDSINPSLPISEFGKMVLQMASDGKIMKRGRFFLVPPTVHKNPDAVALGKLSGLKSQVAKPEPPSPVEVATTPANGVSKIRKDLVDQIDAAIMKDIENLNAEIDSEMKRVMATISKRDKLMGLYQDMDDLGDMDLRVLLTYTGRGQMPAKVVCSFILDMLNQHECRPVEVARELGIGNNACRSYLQQLYTKGLLARRSVEIGNTFRPMYATEHWFQSNGIKNYVSVKRVKEALNTQNKTA